MMYKTHLATGAFFALLFLPAVTHRASFVIVLLICSLLPDIDTMHSKIGRHWLLRPLQWCLKHRDLLHSFTFCLIFTGFFAFYFPIIALPFFLGYAGHLVADAITIEGIRAFWPLKKITSGRIRTGGKAEKVLFYAIILIDLGLLIRFLWLV